MRLRRRFSYPAHDLLTGNARIDLALDAASRAVRGAPRPDLPLPPSSVAVFGFPRSGNTFLTAWLEEFARPGVSVYDSRLTHSSLDLVRCARAGVRTLVPVRDPADAAASWIVRLGQPGSLAAASSALQASAAWMSVALDAVRHGPAVGLIPFEVITEDPWALQQWEPLLPFLDASKLEESDSRRFTARLRERLSCEVGQGAGDGAVPGAWMISLPHPERHDALSLGRRTVHQPSVARVRSHALDAYRALIRAAEVAGVLVSPRRLAQDSGSEHCRA